MRKVWLSVLVALMVGSAVFRTEAAEQKRVALVIGNGAYQHAPTLTNPVNDAHDVAVLLRTLDFEVIEAVDLDRSQFIKAVGSFLEKAAAAPASLFYYGGHGVQFNEDNYLIAIDAKLENIYSLKTEAFSLKEILAELEAVSSVNLVFLDACRDNPLAESLSRSIKTRGGISPIGRGLARVAPNGANTFIAFAASPGEVALDGSGRNSPFTQAFLKNVQAGNDDLMLLFKGVIRDVMGATDGQQRPQMVSGMTIDFYFHGDTTITVSPQLPEAQAAYEAAARIGSKAAYQAIIDSFPNTVQARLAAAAIEALPDETVATLSPPVESPPVMAPTPNPPTPPATTEPPTPGIARRYAAADLPADADPRLSKAIEALEGYEILFDTFEGHLYIAVLTGGMEWGEARQLAEEAGGHLLTVSKKAENDFAFNLYRNDERMSWHENGEDYGPWIGLFQPTGSREPKGGWQWVTGEELARTYWAPGEPSNSHSGEDAAGFIRHRDEPRGSHRWSDYNSRGGGQSFIMEIDTPPSQQG
jgi:uncharacterized caspase-like protein